MATFAHSGTWTATPATPTLPEAGIPPSSRPDTRARTRRTDERQGGSTS